MIIPNSAGTPEPDRALSEMWSDEARAASIAARRSRAVGQSVAAAGSRRRDAEHRQGVKAAASFAAKQKAAEKARTAAAKAKKAGKAPPKPKKPKKPRKIASRTRTTQRVVGQSVTRTSRRLRRREVVDERR